MMQQALSLASKVKISKFTFMKLLIKIFQKQLYSQRKQLMKIFDDFDTNKDGVLSLDEFNALLKSVVPSMPKDMALMIYNEALDFDALEGEDPSDKMTPEAFFETVIKNNVGGFGKEFLILPDEALAIKRKEEQLKVLKKK